MIENGTYVRETATGDIGVVECRADSDRIWVFWETGPESGRLLSIAEDGVEVYDPSVDDPSADKVAAAIKLLADAGYIVTKG